jgi:peptidyl-prolyl cis-trans isomerase B (cyclophilin B)
MPIKEEPKNEKVRYVLLAIIIILIVVAGGTVLLSRGETNEQKTNTNRAQNNVDNGNNLSNNTINNNGGEENEMDNEEKENPIATIEMEDGGIIKIELFPVIAPNTVANFISLANAGFYDGLIFHRTIPEFMLQGGDPDGTGMGGPGYGIKGEFSQNNVKNSISHTRGVISMARSGHPDSAGSQFFIVHEDSNFLDGAYAGFGRVLEGMEVADKIVNVPVITRNPREAGADRPINPPVIKRITIETFGVAYSEPEKR